MNVLAADDRSDIVRLTVCSTVNLPNKLFYDDALSSGVSMATVLPNQQTHFIKKNGIVYIAVTDLCNLTRSKQKTIHGDDISLDQGRLRINLLSMKKDTFNISYEHPFETRGINTNISINYIKDDGVIYVEPEPILSMLSASYFIT